MMIVLLLMMMMIMDRHCVVTDIDDGDEEYVVDYDTDIDDDCEVDEDD